MRIRILGPLELFDGTGWVGLGAAKARALLATLLVRSGSVVSMDRLVFELWGDHPPKTAVTQIHGYVMRLRRILNDRSGVLLATVPPGYRVTLADDDLDARVFGQLLEQGHQAIRGGEPVQAAELLRQALALWRGPALADISQTPLVCAEAHRLAELRLVALEARIDADLDCGRHAALVPELQQYAGEHPLREQPWRQLMLALYRSGRQAEALQTYQRLRQNLVDELGAEPSLGIRRLHQQLLTGETGEADPAELLAEVLRDIGVTRIPDGLPARATLIRSLLSSRRLRLVSA